MRRHTRNLIRLLKRELGAGTSIKSGVEVGVWRGQNAAALLQHLPDLTLAMVDPYDEGGDHSTMSKTPRELRQAKVESDERTRFATNRRSRIFKTSEEAAREFRDRVFDFCFIDACHMYEAVAADIRLWEPKVRPGGVMSGHDYDGRMDRKGVWGVKRAVDEWAAERGYEVGVQPGNVWWVRLPAGGEDPKEISFESLPANPDAVYREEDAEL